eukprot:gene28703-31868_t
MDQVKENLHQVKAADHAKDHEKYVHSKAGDKMERHSLNGHSINEGPKKGGAGGKGTWGDVKDDIKLATMTSSPPS